MNRNINKIKSSYTGKVLSWDQKDDIQKLLTLFESNTVDALNSTLEYSFVMGFVADQLTLINRAPTFWSEVLKALRFTMLMKAARIFDESKDAIGIKKVFNILEQSIYQDIVCNELDTYKKQYESYSKDIEEIRTLRDKVFAHNDKTEFQFWKRPEKPDLEFEGEVWERLEVLLRWVQESTLSLRTALGDGYPIGHEIENDLDKLMDSMVEKRN